MGLEGKVALVTGAARGQGRNHALRLAEAGADVVAIDACRDFEGVPYEMPRPADLEETASLVEERGRRVVSAAADIRDSAALERAIAAGAEELGPIDVVVANAGILTFGRLEEMSEETWQTMIDVNLTGAWRTVKAAAPRMSDGGSVIFISSVLGLKAAPGVGHYVAAKHGLVGLMRAFAHELSPRRIRVNSVHPTEVNTDMLLHQAMYDLYRPDLEQPGIGEFQEVAQMSKLLPTPWVEPADVSAAVLFLASDEARFLTGVTLPVDAGAFSK